MPDAISAMACRRAPVCLDIGGGDDAAFALNQQIVGFYIAIRTVLTTRERAIDRRGLSSDNFRSQ
jgi:hypothetical protein